MTGDDVRSHQRTLAAGDYYWVLGDGQVQGTVDSVGDLDEATLIVHETDPRYTGNPDWSVWGSWEYHVLTVNGFGNLVRPRSHVGG